MVCCLWWRYVRSECCWEWFFWVCWSLCWLCSLEVFGWVVWLVLCVGFFWVEMCWGVRFGKIRFCRWMRRLLGLCWFWLRFIVVWDWFVLRWVFVWWEEIVWLNWVKLLGLVRRWLCLCRFCGWWGRWWFID